MQSSRPTTLCWHEIRRPPWPYDELLHVIQRDRLLITNFHKTFPFLGPRFSAGVEIAAG